MFGNAQNSSGAGRSSSNKMSNSNSYSWMSDKRQSSNTFAMRRIGVKKGVPTIPVNTGEYSAKVQADPQARRMSNHSGGSEAELIRVDVQHSVVHEDAIN